MVWDPTHPITNAAIVSEPLRDNFAVLDTALIAPLTALTNHQVLVKTAGPVVAGVPPGINGQVLTMVAGVPIWGAGAMDLVESTKAGLPAPGTSGLLRHVTDDVRGIWMDTGTAWFPTNATVVNVKEFGAIGDGVTDDTAAIQAAIDAVKGSTHTAPYTTMTGSVEIPAGIYRLSAPIRVYSGLIVRGTTGERSLLKAGPGFVGASVIALATVGTYYANGLLADLNVESAAGSGIAAIAPIGGTVSIVNSQFVRLQLNTAQGLLLGGAGVYCQSLVLDTILSYGPVDTIVHLKGNWNHLSNIDKEGALTGTSTAPYILIEAHASGQSSGNVLERILLEGTGSENKSGIKLDGVDQMTLRDYWFEMSASDGYLLRVVNSTEVMLQGAIKHLTPTAGKIKVDTTRSVAIDCLNTASVAAPLANFLEIDAVSRVHINRAVTRDGQEAYRLDRWTQALTLDEHYAQATYTGAIAGYLPAQTARYLTGQNLFVNPSFEAGRYGWTFAAAAPTTEEYLASEVGVGLMGHFLWAAGGTNQLRQTVTVPAAWVGQPLTISFFAKMTGTGQITPVLFGAGFTAPTGQQVVKTGAGWCLVTQTFVPQSAGSLNVGIYFVSFGTTTEAWIDECHLAFGTVGVPNPAKWASYELNGKTYTNAAAIPTTGTWKVGDIVWNSGAGVAGWKCSAAGTPGTWEELASTAVAPPYPLRAPDGTVAAPSYSFANDTAAGMFWLGGSPTLVDGGTRIASWATSGFNIDKGAFLVRDLGVNAGFTLVPEASHVMAQRNAANAQAYRLYGTWTDASNYERLTLSHTIGTGATLAVETAGTGGDNLDLALTPAGTGRVRINTALNTAVGGGATAAFTANMVGSAGGPTTAAQNGWLLLKDSTGAAIWVPVWK